MGLDPLMILKLCIIIPQSLSVIKSLIFIRKTSAYSLKINYLPGLKLSPGKVRLVAPIAYNGLNSKMALIVLGPWYIYRFFQLFKKTLI